MAVLQPNDPWTAYWQAGRLDSCIAAGNADDQAELARYWSTFATTLDANARVLDLATGNGAVPRRLLEAAPGLAITALDKAAIEPGRFVKGQPLLERVRFLGGVDLAALPDFPEPFAAVTSQFGIEYAGVSVAASAVSETVGAGGVFQFLLHHVDSAVLTPARRDRAELEALLAEDGFLRALLDACAGRAPAGRVRERLDAYMTAPVQRTRRISAAVVAACEQTLAELGGGGKLSLDPKALIARLHAEWQRLRQLEKAALDDRAMAALLARLEASGLRVDSCEPLELGRERGEPALVGWHLAGGR